MLVLQLLTRQLHSDEKFNHHAELIKITTFFRSVSLNSPGCQDDDHGGVHLRRVLASLPRLLHRVQRVPRDQLLAIHSGEYKINGSPKNLTGCVRMRFIAPVNPTRFLD